MWPPTLGLLVFNLQRFSVLMFPAWIPISSLTPPPPPWNYKEWWTQNNLTLTHRAVEGLWHRTGLYLYLPVIVKPKILNRNTDGGRGRARALPWLNSHCFMTADSKGRWRAMRPQGKALVIRNPSYVACPSQSVYAVLGLLQRWVAIRQTAPRLLQPGKKSVSLLFPAWRKKT